MGFGLAVGFYEAPPFLIVCFIIYTERFIHPFPKQPVPQTILRLALGMGSN